MAILLKVTWIDKSGSDSFHCIRHIGGNTKELNWKHTQAQAIRSIEDGSFAYYVETGDRMAELQVGLSPDGQKYLKTVGDADYPALLIGLPPFPNALEARV